MKKLALFLILALLLSLGAACTKTEPAPTQAPTPTEAPASTEAPVPTEAPAPTDAPVPTEAPAPTDAPAPTEAPAPSGEGGGDLAGSYWMGVRMEHHPEGQAPSVTEFEDWQEDMFTLLLEDGGSGIFRTTYWSAYDADSGFITWSAEDGKLDIQLSTGAPMSAHLEGDELILSDYYDSDVVMVRRDDRTPAGADLTPDMLMGSWIVDSMEIEGSAFDPREEHLLVYLVCEEDGASIYWNDPGEYASFYEEHLDYWYNWTPLYDEHEANGFWKAELIPEYYGHREYTVTATGPKEAEMIIYSYNGIEEYPSVVWCHLIPASPKSVVKPSREPVTVDNVGDLILNLRDGAEILLEPGTYDVTEWLQDHPYDVGDWSYINDESWAWGIFSMGADSPELMIAGMKDVTIKAAYPEELTTIVCQPRYANVISFQNCHNIRLEGITMGHTIEPGYCSGAVLNFSNCGMIYLTGLDLYGCGTYGITSYDSYYIFAEDCVIHDCTYGCVSLMSSYGCNFIGCEFRDCEGFYMIDVYNAGAYFQRCTFQNLKGDMFSEDTDSYVTIEECSFDEAAKASVESNACFGVTIQGDWESATSAKAKG